MNLIEKNAVRVLIVDDDLGTRKILESIVKKVADDVQVEVAVDGNDALKKCRTFLPQIVFLDYMLPKIDGLKVARFIKGDAKFRDARIILMTASDSIEMERVAQRSGADFLLAKPLDVSLIKAQLTKYLAEIRETAPR